MALTDLGPTLDAPGVRQFSVAECLETGMTSVSEVLDVLVQKGYTYERSVAFVHEDLANGAIALTPEFGLRRT